MNSIDLLILDGPPAVGKSSLATAIAAELREHEVRHAVIELDDLARVYPLSLLEIMYQNLASIWPNYEALDDIKVIIPTYMQRGEHDLVMKAAPAKRTTICEVIVPADESIRRIEQRETDEAARKRLIDYVNGYPNNRTPAEYVDFSVANTNRSVRDAAQEVIYTLQWLPRSVAK